MITEMKFIEKPKADDGEPGYVKGLITYLVMDDLSVMPMSTISAIVLLKKFQVKDLSMLSEMTIEFGMKEVVDFHHILIFHILASYTRLCDVLEGINFIIGFKMKYALENMHE
jgi:Protein of unknown function (DUF674)